MRCFVRSASARKSRLSDVGTRIMEMDSAAASQLKRINLSVFFASLGLASVYLIPAFAEDLGASYLDLGFIGTVRSLPYMFLPVIVGYLGDRFERRRLFLASVFIAGVATLMLASTHTIEGIVLVQVLLGIGFSLFWPLSEALVSENAPLHRQTAVLGMYGVAWASGFLFGPLLGGFIANAAGFQLSFLFSGVIVLATAVVSVALIRGQGNSPSYKTKTAGKPDWGLVSKVLPALVVQVPYGVVFAFIGSIFPGYAIQSGLTPFQVGVLVSGLTLARMVMFSLSGRFERVGERKSTALAFIGLAFVLLLIPFNRSFLALMADICAVGALIGIIYPQTVGYVCKHSPVENLGFAVGLYETIFGIGFAAGPIISGLIAQVVGLDAAYLTLAIVALSAAPILVFPKVKHAR